MPKWHLKKLELILHIYKTLIVLGGYRVRPPFIYTLHKNVIIIPKNNKNCIIY